MPSTGVVSQQLLGGEQNEMGPGLPGFAERIGHKAQIAPFGWKAQICTSRSHELNVDMHSFKNQLKRGSLGLFPSKLILVSLWRSGWEAVPFTCRLSWLRRCLRCLEALTTCAGTVVGHFGPCLVWGRSSVWCTTPFWSGPGWLWLCGGTWWAQVLLWWPAGGLLQPLVVSFNLINACSAAGTCYGHATKPGLLLLQSVAAVQRGVFGDESGCWGVKWEIICIWSLCNFVSTSTCCIILLWILLLMYSIWLVFNYSCQKGIVLYKKRALQGVPRDKSVLGGVDLVTGKAVKVGWRIDLSKSRTQQILADVSRGSQMCSEPTMSAWEVCLCSGFILLFCFSLDFFFFDVFQ